MSTKADMTAVRDNANASGEAWAGRASRDWDLEALVRKHQAELWRYARFLGSSASEADDLVQEAFLAVHRKPFQQQCDAQSAAYLRTVVRRCLLMARRKEGKQVRVIADDEALLIAEQVWSAHASEGRWNSYLEALDDCVERLSQRARQCLHLFYREQAAREDVARRLGMKPNGVKTMLRRARKSLHDCIRRKVNPE